MEKKYIIAVADEDGNIVGESTKLDRDELNLLLNAWLEIEMFEDHHFIVRKDEK